MKRGELIIYNHWMINDKKPAWLLRLLASAREGEPNEDYIRAWVADHKDKMDSERGSMAPLTDRDNLEIGRLLDKDKRGPMV